MIRITNLSVPFDDETPLAVLAAKRLKLPPQAVLEAVVLRRAIDARRYRNAPISFVYTLDVQTSTDERKVVAKLRGDKNVSLSEAKTDTAISQGSELLNERPIIVGFGPAGMFAGLTLAEQGYRPLILERGADVDRRSMDIQKFWQSGVLDVKSNVQFGEGGAGTFSDGKLTTRMNDTKMAAVLNAFVDAGAPPEIKYLQKPHIGTDILRTVVKNIRKKIIALGGEVRFNAQVTDFEIANGKLCSVEVNNAERIPTKVVLLGIGHSARDTYRLLAARQIAMQAKAFAIGVRIEHPQEWIDKAQYGDFVGHKRLPTADYALTYQDKSSGRGVYSFCMCPGGQVVAAASAHNQLVTNGMSQYARDSSVANSALLVTVTPDDFGDKVLSGIDFQEKYESLAFQVGGGTYEAPVQSVGDFLSGTYGSIDYCVAPTYRPGFRPVSLKSCLPDFVVDALQQALPHFDSKIKGFAAADVPMTGIETRSSAPCRIMRTSSHVSVNTEGLYPMGEGAGYAGGIMSAAVDGIYTAIAFMEKYKV